jgi:hypothetical protein
MLRTIFAVAISGLVLAAISGASQATPIAPLPAGVVSDVAAGNVTQVHACGWRCRQLHRSRIAGITSIIRTKGAFRSWRPGKGAAARKNALADSPIPSTPKNP